MSNASGAGHGPPRASVGSPGAKPLGKKRKNEEPCRQRPAIGRGLSARPRSPTPSHRPPIARSNRQRPAAPNKFPAHERRRRAQEELSRSIRANGIIQPIVARKVDQGYEIIAGERRWRAAQRAGLLKVPVVVRDIPEERLLAVALIENIQREDLNPIEEAVAYRRLSDKFHLREQIADRWGRPLVDAN